MIPCSVLFRLAFSRLCRRFGFFIHFDADIMIPHHIHINGDALFSECQKELNNVPCVIRSCIKMHATHKIVNYASRLML